MNLLHALDHADLWQFAGWTMLHFLWLGAMAGIAAGLCRLALRRASARLRYAVSVASFALLATLPIGIAAWLVEYRADSFRTVAIENGVASQISGAVVLTPSVASTAEIDSGRMTDDVSSNMSAPPTSPRQSRGLTSIVGDELSNRVVAVLESCARYLPWIWLAGTPITFALLASGVVGAERLRRGSRLVADGPTADACARLVAGLDIGRHVAIAVCERIAAPVLVGIVRPIILLPPAALTGWSPDEIEMVLLHELAHVRRWDNLVNLVQRLVESLLFFHPAVWLVSRWVRCERELCCDAVVIGRTNRPHAYAEMLVALAAQMPRSVLFHPAATSAMAFGPLRGRIRRILQLEDDPMLISGKSLVIALSGLLLAATLMVLNLSTRTQAMESAAEQNKKATAEGTEEQLVSVGEDAATNSEVSSLTDQTLAEVPFVLGATRFVDGDRITVQEVRGTAEAFEPGNIYWIKGTYTLGSRDRAALSAFTTARDSANGTGPIWKIQTTVVHRGSGTFTLCLPMSCSGWPHLSFYPDKGGDSFGGTYFGTGDSVLQQWWESNEATEPAASAGDTTKGLAKFPSLEEQKLADEAYRRLGQELEPLSDADLKRVKALGYDGGLLVTRGNGDQSNWNNVHWGDLLVGLHVWPTTTLKDVADVLNRDDLPQLDPLKFYVVRPGAGPNKTGDFYQSEEDGVVTGRISVSFDGSRGRSSNDKPSSTSTSAPTQLGSGDRWSAPQTLRVLTATPGRVHLGATSSSTPAEISEEQLNKRLMNDPNMTMMNQQYLQYQNELSSLSAATHEHDSREAERTKKQIVALMESLDQYRQRVREQFSGIQQQPAVAPKVLAEARLALKVAAAELDFAAKRKQQALAKREQAGDHDALAATNPEFEAADRQFNEAKRSFEEAKRSLEELQRQHEAHEWQQQELTPDSSNEASIGQKLRVVENQLEQTRRQLTEVETTLQQVTQAKAALTQRANQLTDALQKLSTRNEPSQAQQQIPDER